MVTSSAPPSATEVTDACSATNQHYELPAELFAAYLDPRLKYSSGWYDTAGTTLAEAQTAKLRYVARCLAVTPGARVLDIGCGWGSLVLFMATEYGCRVTGVTPSATQAEYITGLAAERGVAGQVDIKLGRFSGLDLDAGRYDAVSMLGSIIHMPDREVVLNRVARLLRRDGRLYLSESCFRNAATYDEFAGRPGTRHVTKGIFGFADMVPLSVLVEAVEVSGLSLVGLDDLTGHYKRTIEDWESLAVANRDTIERVAPGQFEPLVRYLHAANAGWGYTTKHYALTAAKARYGLAAT